MMLVTVSINGTKHLTNMHIINTREINKAGATRYLVKVHEPDGGVWEEVSVWHYRKDPWYKLVEIATKGLSV